MSDYFDDDMRRALGYLDIGTQIIITPPQGAVQILVRVPHPYEKDQVQVDYRQAPGETWSPHEFWDDTVQVNVG